MKHASQFHRYRRVHKRSPYGLVCCTCAQGLTCRARVTRASSPASHCKQCSALTSPALHAGGCTRPSRARGGHKNRLFFQPHVPSGKIHCARYSKTRTTDLLHELISRFMQCFHSMTWTTMIARDTHRTQHCLVSGTVMGYRERVVLIAHARWLCCCFSISMFWDGSRQEVDCMPLQQRRVHTARSVNVAETDISDAMNMETMSTASYQ
jgi:hypothetical protein